MKLFALTLLSLVAGAATASVSPGPGMNHFATATYQELARGHQNLIVSPYSIANALAMVLNGARGGTAAQIAKVLHQAGRDPEFDQALATMASELARAANSGPNQLLMANGLWVQSGFRIQTPFQQAMETLYHAPLKRLDFAANPTDSADEINAWTAQHTKGKIAELFAPGSFDASTRLVLTSAIYFYGKWRSPFRPADTHPAPFHLTGGRTVETKFMNQTADFGYAETPSMQLLEMRYADTPLAFDILLPKKGDGSADLEQSLSPAVLGDWLGGLQSRNVDVAIPKFQAESGFSLRETLARLGMPEAFTRAADFSGIDDRRDLFLSDVNHKAFVDVSEEGTEAAAATGSMVSYVAMMHSPRTVFRADHPFAFLVRDQHSGVILFEGRLAQPDSAK